MLMNDEAVTHLWTLWNLNKALIRGLKAAVSALENIDDLPPAKRQDVIDSLNKLIAHHENLSQDEPIREWIGRSRPNHPPE
jgi:phage-related protein